MTTEDRSITASDYIKENFEPRDRIALLILNRQTGESVQRITSAEKAGSSEFQAWLRHRNARGDEVYLGMNPLKQDAVSRSKDQVSTIRHLYIDLDHGGEHAIARIRNSGLVPQPNYVLNTSPSRYQVVWKVEGVGQAEAESLQRAMVTEFGGDPAATDSTRVLRLPGFTNRKRQPPHIVRAQSESSQTYHLEDFKLRTDPEERREHAVPTQVREREPREEVTQSELDWAFAKRALARGDDPELVIQRISDFRVGDKANPGYYARLTVTKAKAELRAKKNSPDTRAASAERSSRGMP